MRLPFCGCEPSPRRRWSGPPRPGPPSFHDRHHVVDRSLTRPFQPGVLPRPPKVRSNLRPVQFGEPLDGEVAHPFASSLQDTGAILQLGAPGKPEVHVFRIHGDETDAVLEDTLRRAIQQRDPLGHPEDVLVARRHLFEHDLPESEGDRLNGRIERKEEFDQFARRLRHDILPPAGVPTAALCAAATTPTGHHPGSRDRQSRSLGVAELAHRLQLHELPVLAQVEADRTSWGRRSRPLRLVPKQRLKPTMTHSRLMTPRAMKLCSIVEITFLVLTIPA